MVNWKILILAVLWCLVACANLAPTPMPEATRKVVPTAAVRSDITPLPTRQSPEKYQPGQLTIDGVEVAGELRAYRVYLPTSYEVGSELAVVINLHPFNSTPDTQEIISSMSAFAEKGPFIVIYPLAVGSPKAWTLDVAGPANSDVAYIRAILAKLPEDISFAADRLFVTGMSNGGGMTHRLGCDLADQIVAIAPVAGVYPDDVACEPERPVAVLAFHGDGDSVVPFAGDPDRGLRAIDDWASRWSQRNGCAGNAISETPERGFQQTVWHDCAAGGGVTLYQLYGWEHLWPNPLVLPPGPNDPDVDATALIWRFFERQQ